MAIMKTDELPNNTTLLQQMLIKQSEQISFLQNQLQQQTILMDKLQAQVEQLLRQLYGKKSEKGIPGKKDEPETNLNQEGPPQENLRPRTETSATNKSSGRQKLPAHLPRERIEYTLPPLERGCPDCDFICKRMGETISEQLDFIPAKLIVKQHVRHKYACPNCKSYVIQAPMPNQPIDKGIPGAGLLAEILINKYQDGLPLYRQEQRFNRLGYELSRKTLCDWIGQSSLLFRALRDEMKKDLLLSMKLHTDDTLLLVQSTGKVHKGRLWVYLANASHGPPICIYDYSKTRSGKYPLTFLKDYAGYLQADAYPGYDKLYFDGRIIEVACMAHARRKFFEIAEKVKAPSLAHDVLDHIGILYGIERECAMMGTEKRYFYRKHYAKRPLKKFYRFLKKCTARSLPKAPITAAMEYTLNNWKALNTYLCHGDLHIDNNAAERAIKPVVIGRKNYLFAGSHEGAENAAIIYSLIETCKLNQINTSDYFKDILTRLPNQKAKDIRELLPYCWKPAYLPAPHIKNQAMQVC